MTRRKKWKNPLAGGFHGQKLAATDHLCDNLLPKVDRHGVFMQSRQQALTECQEFGPDIGRRHPESNWEGVAYEATERPSLTAANMRYGLPRVGKGHASLEIPALKRK